jgi:Uma2 family endonuclease
MDAVAALPRSRPLTRADLLDLPDDGHRYELLDGSLLVTPAPSPRHQTVVLALARRLVEARPSGLWVGIAPVDVVLGDNTVLQPDVVVTRVDDVTDDGVRGTPLLVVEVLSPSTRHLDLGSKRARYEAQDVPSYWAIDPEEPRLLVWRLGATGYALEADRRAAEVFEGQLPFPVSVMPADLLQG